MSEDVDRDDLADRLESDTERVVEAVEATTATLESGESPSEAEVTAIIEAAAELQHTAEERVGEVVDADRLDRLDRLAGEL